MEKQHELMNYRDLLEFGFPRSRVYELLHRKDLPIIKIGGRKYMVRSLFMEWLRDNVANNPA